MYRPRSHSVTWIAWGVLALGLYVGVYYAMVTPSPPYFGARKLKPYYCFPYRFRNERIESLLPPIFAPMHQVDCCIIRPDLWK